MTDAYYILEDGEQRGPYTFEELTDMELDIHTRVLSPLADTWQDACDLPEFYRYFESLGIYLPTEDNLASFWWRLLAFVIDYAIVSVITQFIFAFLATRGIQFKLQSVDDLLKLPPAQLLTLTLITSLTWVIYNSACESSSMMGSVGKRLCRMVVVDANGMRLTYLNAFSRSIGKILSMTILYAGFLSVLFTDHKQALHDFLARTYVVKRD